MELYTFQDFYIPERMMPGIKSYIEERLLPGNFLRGVISNDLKTAVMYADEENIRNLPAYVSYFYNHAPMDCWGSEEAMRRWVENDTTPPDNH